MPLGGPVPALHPVDINWSFFFFLKVGSTFIVRLELTTRRSRVSCSTD